MQLLRRASGHLVIRLAGDFPFLPLLVRAPAFSCFAQRFQSLPGTFPDHVDLGVVGDGLERDVRHTLIDKALADVAMRRLAGWRGAGDFGFLDLAVAAVGEQVVGIARTHDAGTGQRQGHAGGVDGDPAAAPLLGDIGGGAGAAGRVEHEVAGVGGHQDTTLNHLGIRLNDIDLCLS